MKELLRLALSIAVLLLSQSTTRLSAQSVAKAADQPTVVVAVAPDYLPIARAMGARGEVVIEVTIDAKGKIVSASIISGNEYLRGSSKKAAMNWQFGAVDETQKTRSVRLTFAYRFADVGAPLRAQPEITTVFKPPYRVELILEPYIIN